MTSRAADQSRSSSTVGSRAARAGIAVNVAAPERYAVHKQIVTTRRSGAGRLKAAKAGALIRALVETRQADLLRDAWDHAWSRGPHWRQALTKGWPRLEPTAAEMLPATIGPSTAPIGSRSRWPYSTRLGRAP